MKKTVLEKTLCCAFAVLFLTAAVFLSSPKEAHALKEMILLDVTGIFESLDETVTPNVIILNVGGQQASGPLWHSYNFFDEKEQSLSLEDFTQRYLKQEVALEIIEDTGEVYSGRPAKK
jgi:hypothetical protein